MFGSKRRSIEELTKALAQSMALNAKLVSLGERQSALCNSLNREIKRLKSQIKDLRELEALLTKREDEKNIHESRS